LTHRGHFAHVLVTCQSGKVCQQKSDVLNSRATLPTLYQQSYVSQTKTIQALMEETRTV